MSTIIFQTATRLLVPLSLLFSLFIYFKGHQSPGGGFVAGLVMAVALAVHRMSHGRASLRRMMWLRERDVIAIGLAIALLTSAGSLVLGKPFLRTAFGYVRLPGVGFELEWATAMLFDLGVMMVVAGVVLGMINALAEEAEMPDEPEELE